MAKLERKTLTKVLDVIRTTAIIVLLGAVVVQSGILDGACSEKAYAETATSHSIAKGVGKVSQYDNGTYIHDFNEGVLGVNGEVAFCMNPNVGFKSGTVSSASILTVVSQAQLTEIALRAHFVRDLYHDNYLSDNARIILAQTLVWEVISPSQSFVVVAAENGGGFSEVTAAVREDVCAKARAFAAANANRYDSYGTLWVNGSTQPVATFGCTLVVGTIDLLKVSANPSVSDGNACYSLGNATYGIYANPECTSEACRLSTDESGYALSSELRIGTYYVREIAAPAGFAVDGTVYPVSVAAGQTVRVGGGAVCDVPVVRSGIASIDKHDAEIGWKPEPSAALGCATVAGATYKVEHYGGSFESAAAAADSGKPLATWEFVTNADGRIDLTRPDDFLVSGELYRDANGAAVFPLGTYVITESTASTGYLLSSETFLVSVGQEGDAARMDGAFQANGERQAVAAAEQVKRSDISLTKVRESDMTRLAGIPFTLTSETTGESHVIVTDENGRVDTSAAWNPHTVRTNANDGALVEDGTVDEERLDATAGVWFGMHGDGAITQASDTLGALPYDTYTLQELPCSANAGLVLVRMAHIALTRDSITMDLGTIDDKESQLPSITTVAYDAADRDKLLSAGERAAVKDEVELADLVEGRTYTLYGTVIDARTGLPALADPGADGSEPKENAANATEGNDEDLQAFWDGLTGLLGAKRTPSIEGFTYEIESAHTFDGEAIGQYLAENEAIASRMIVASLEFEADAPNMVTALDYEMDASAMEGDYVIYDLLVGDDGTMAIHADSQNERESFTVEQPEPAGKGYYKTGNGLAMPLGATGMAAGSAIGAGIFVGRRFSWRVPWGRKHA